MGTGPSHGLRRRARRRRIMTAQELSTTWRAVVERLGSCSTPRARSSAGVGASYHLVKRTSESQGEQREPRAPRGDRTVRGVQPAPRSVVPDLDAALGLIDLLREEPVGRGGVGQPERSARHEISLPDLGRQSLEYRAPGTSVHAFGGRRRPRLELLYAGGDRLDDVDGGQSVHQLPAAARGHARGPAQRGKRRWQFDLTTFTDAASG